MSLETQTPQSHQARLKFLRIAGIAWALLIASLIVGALLAPYLGRIADVILHQTRDRDWTRLKLEVDDAFLDVSTPMRAVKSYYSALYRGDAVRMASLTSGPFHDQMRQRLADPVGAQNNPTYRSYLRLEKQEAERAVVMEKFHLFWHRGLRFHLHQTAAEWRITGMELVQ